MGYSHYWYRKPEAEPTGAYEAFAEDARAIIVKATNEGIDLGDWHGEGIPLIDGSVVRLNGLGSESCESFRWLGDLLGDMDEYDAEYYRDNGTVFDSCKTRQRPYDAVVCALLIAAKHHYGDSVIIDSDGSWADWAEGAALYRAATKRIAAPVLDYMTA